MSQDLANSVQQTVGEIKDKVSRVQETLKRRNELSSLQSQKLDHLVRLGTLVYRSLRTGQLALDEQFREDSGAVFELDLKIAVLDHELRELEHGQQVVCPGCARVNTGAPTFCSGCGANLPELIATLPTCGACKQLVTAGARFCGCCGTPAGGA